MKKSVFTIFSFLFLCLLLFVVGLYFFVSEFVFPLKYVNEINEFSEKYGLESSLVSSVINAESSFNSNAVSGKGAMGLMQIMPKTALWIASEIGVKNFESEELLNPKTNIEFGCFYLNYLIKKFKNIKTALAAYNAGEGVVSKWLSNKEFSVDNISLVSIPYKETENYVKKIDNGLRYYSKKF